jgi:hypothetical protein
VNQINKRVYNAIDPTQPTIDFSSASLGALAVIGGVNNRDKTKYPIEESA